MVFTLYLRHSFVLWQHVKVEFRESQLGDSAGNDNEVMAIHDALDRLDAVNLNLTDASTSEGAAADCRDLVFVDLKTMAPGDLSIQATGLLSYSGNANVGGIEIVSSLSRSNVNIDVQDISVTDVGILLGTPAVDATGTTDISARDIEASNGLVFITAQNDGAVNINVRDIEFDNLGMLLPLTNTQGGDSVIKSTGELSETMQ